MVERLAHYSLPAHSLASIYFHTHRFEPWREKGDKPGTPTKKFRRVACALSQFPQRQRHEQARSCMRDMVLALIAFP
jgi:hypothetical protein